MPIRDLVDQEPEVWSLDEQHRLIAARADTVWRVGRRAVYQVKLASGRTIHATAEHRLLAGSGWSTVSNLAVGDRLALARRLPAPAQCLRWPEHWLVLLGHLVGDGSYLKHQPLRYTSASEWNLTVVAQAAMAFGSRVRRYPPEGVGGSSLSSQVTVTAGIRPVSDVGSKSWAYSVSAAHENAPEVFTLADDQVALLLSHLWATDGSITLRKPGQRGTARVYFASSSLGLVQDVAALLLRLGVVARIVRFIPKAIDRAIRPMLVEARHSKDSSTKLAELVRVNARCASWPRSWRVVKSIPT